MTEHMMDRFTIDKGAGFGLRKLPKWDEHLNDYLFQAQRKEFKYGEHDCVTFVVGAVESMTGIGLLKGIQYTPDTKDQALRVYGRGTLYRTLVHVFGKPKRGVYGRKGDIAFYEGACGVVLGRTALFLGDEGMRLVTISKIPRAFRIGVDV